MLDIDDLYRRMTERGIRMIDEIQGPPRWEGPDVLLRQTSFKALAERRRFREADGSVVDGELSVRFGEVEQVFTAPHLVFFPGLAIMLTVLGFNLFGDGLRDAFDPKLKN